VNDAGDGETDSKLGARARLTPMLDGNADADDASACADA